MDIFLKFIVNNFLLFCIAVVLIVNSIMRYKQHPRISLCTILLMSNTLLLAIINLLIDIGRDIANPNLAMIASAFGYVFRPICIIFIVVMTGKITKKMNVLYLCIPLRLNAIVYIFAFIPATRDAVFYYDYNDLGGIAFHGGLFRFSSHIISGLYLIFILYISFTKISSKHIAHGLTILSCSLFIVFAVIIESFFNDDGSIELLNDTIAVSALVYYLYLYIERTQIDTLTGLFNRETYYHDVIKMDKTLKGVVQFDMNGLKYINDNHGHMEGDKAISTVASVINKSANKSMYIYRLGGDEFIILTNNCDEKDLINTVETFKKNLSETPYKCSVGYAYKEDKNISSTDLMKIAEKHMYEDKELFYKNTGFDRRKV